MAVAVQLPALSPTMTEGRITRWLKKEGDSISSGMAIAECETDKSNIEIESYDDGTLLKIVVREGEAAKIGAPIAYLGKPGEAVPDDAPKAKAALVSVEAVPLSHSVPAAPALVPVPGGVSSQRLRASPLAKKMAQNRGLDLGAVVGSGPLGRIVKKDVEAALAAEGGEGTQAQMKTVPLSSMRRVIAQRLTEVKPGVPHFYLQVEVEMDEALKLKEEAQGQKLKISVNDIVVKATAMAVRLFPRVNQVFLGDAVGQLQTVDVGVAVAIEDGLITPVVREADRKSLSAIAGEVRELAERARRKALRPEEYSGGSITVSNLGMFGIDSFSAVINAPQAAILAVGKVEPRVVVRLGQMAIRQMMSVTLSGDHRVIDGAVGAQFLSELKGFLENPLRLVF